MSRVQKIKTSSYCVDGRPYRGIKIPSCFFNSKGTEMLKSNCTKCKRNKLMTVSDDTIDAEGLKKY